MERQLVSAHPNEESVAYRRKLVGQLWLRGLEKEEIVEALWRNGLRDPGSGEAYRVEIIDEDILTLEVGWREEMRVQSAGLQARCWAELREVKRKAWQEGNMGLVLRVLRQEETMLKSPVGYTSVCGGDSFQELLYSVAECEVEPAILGKIDSAGKVVGEREMAITHRLDD